MVTLHDELLAILAAHGNRWMSLDEMAEAVNARGHYRKRDGSPMGPGQIQMRTRAGGSYEALFERDGRRVRARGRMSAEDLRSEAATGPGPARDPVARPVAQADSRGTAEAALLALRGPGWRIVDAGPHVPPDPGLYAIYGDHDVWRALGLGEAPDLRPLYVGKSESSLVDRDLDTHFGSGHTGSSTVRRSFAALLRMRLELKALPRNPARPERFANYGLSAEDDARLTRWMRTSLTIAVWPMTGIALAPIEVAVLRQLLPPLNLRDVVTPWTAQVKRSRAVMADEARLWAAEHAARTNR